MENIVQCHSGYQYAEKPKSFYWENEWQEVLKVRACWRTPLGITFRILTKYEQVFDLSYDEENDGWSIKPR